MDQSTELQLDMGGITGRVSALLLCPPDPWILYVLAHGAGAGMRHPFMAKVAAALASKGIATLRYQFPYLEAGRRRPDSPAVLETTVRAAVAQGGEAVPGLPMIAGGKSLGGRMTSGAAAGGQLEGVRGLAFLGFPLHPPGEPGTGRAEHLRRVNLPMLFLQGTRDTFARLDLITAVCTDLGPQAALHIISDADHSFGVPARTGRTPSQVFDELAAAIAGWARTLVGNPIRA